MRISRIYLYCKYKLLYLDQDKVKANLTSGQLHISKSLNPKQNTGF